jgi:uncharacterized protein YcbX
VKVASLWRYPVKSMLGERCTKVEIEERGVRGDRAFAVRDAEGKLGSGKDTRRMRHLDGLFSHAARGEGDALAVCLPHGRWISFDSASIHAELSRSLGTPVTLAPEQDVQHFDAAPLHLLTTASLAWLRERLPASAIDERRFRPNIVVAAPGATQVEQSWIGRSLRLGPQVILRIVAPCERCAMTTFAQPELPADPRVLRCLAQQADQLFGVYAEVIRPGTVATGDAAILG